MSEATPFTFADFAALIEELPIAVRTARRMRGLSVRAAAREIGISFATVDRVEKGTECDTGTLLAILRWLDQTRDAGRAGQEAGT